MCVRLQFVTVFAALASCAAADCLVQPGSVLRVDLAGQAIVKPAAVLTGALARPLYSKTCLVVAQGTGVRAVVDQLNAGVAYLTGKVLDDMLEEGAKAAMGAAVAGSAATAARYVGLASGAFVFLMHRGRDVSLGPQTQLELTFSRDVHIQSPTVDKR